MKRIRKSPVIRLGLLLVWAVTLLGAALPGFSAEPVKFTVPLVVNGITYQGVGELSADGSIRVTVVIVYRQAVPGPQPEPKPKPEPDPIPVTKPIAVFVVYESQDPQTNSPKFVAVKNGQTWRKAADAAGIPQHVWDKDDKRFEKSPGVLNKAKVRGLPSVVFVYADGNAEAVAVPESDAATADLVKKFAGVKP